jgi:hypothetical protein
MAEEGHLDQNNARPCMSKSDDTSFPYNIFKDQIKPGNFLAEQFY